MTGILHYLIPIAMGAVALVLLLGLLNLARGGSSERSQRLMQLRVLFQFIAVVLMMALLYFGSR